MNDIKNIIETGLKLEAERRSPPFDDKGMPIHFEQKHKEYCEFLIKHGWLLLNNMRNY